MFEKSEVGIAKLTAAIASAQSEFEAVGKDGENPHFKSKYATLSGIWDAIRPVLKKHGIAVIQIPEYRDGIVELVTVVAHGASSEWIAGRSASPVSKQDPQGVGSAITYLRRYALSAMLGIVSGDDDDGNAASTPVMTRPKPDRVEPPPVPRDIVDRVAEINKANVEAFKSAIEAVGACAFKGKTLKDLADWLTELRKSGKLADFTSVLERKYQVSDDEIMKFKGEDDD